MSYIQHFSVYLPDCEDIPVIVCSLGSYRLQMMFRTKVMKAGGSRVPAAMGSGSSGRKEEPGAGAREGLGSWQL